MPNPLCSPEQSKHKNIPFEIEAQWAGLLSQSKHDELLSSLYNSIKSFFSICCFCLSRMACEASFKFVFSFFMLAYLIFNSFD